MRRAYIARHAFEFGQVNRKQLCEAFDISPAQALADFQELLRAFPDLLKYDLSGKRYLWNGGHALPVLPFPIESLRFHKS